MKKFSKTITKYTSVFVIIDLLFSVTTMILLALYPIVGTKLPFTMYSPTAYILLNRYLINNLLWCLILAVLLQSLKIVSAIALIRKKFSLDTDVVCYAIDFVICIVFCIVNGISDWQCVAGIIFSSFMVCLGVMTRFVNKEKAAELQKTA